MAGKYAKQSKKSTHDYRILFYCLLALVVIGIGILCIKIVPKYTYDKNYNQAMSLLSEQKYEDALSYFNRLPNYNFDDTNAFFEKYITSLCDSNQYSVAYSVLAGNKITGKALAFIGDNTISEMELYIQYNEAEHFADTGNYADAYYQFIRLADYRDSSQRANEILENRKADFYNDALASLDEKTSVSVDKALAIFQLIPDYEESAEYIDMIRFMKRMCGTYKKTGILDNDATYVIDYYQVTRYEGNAKTVSSMYISGSQKSGYYYVTEDLPLTQMFMFDDNTYRYGAYWRYATRNYSTDFEKLNLISSSTEQILQPAVGMTREQVEKSTWGKPGKINKTTYSWGTTEQWVYADYRYIYFRDGIVSAITE